MSVSDPLGDMLTRIRNAQMRRRPKVSTPASALRGSVLEVLQDEGYINCYARVDHAGGKAEFEIDLRYYNGEEYDDYFRLQLAWDTTLLTR